MDNFQKLIFKLAETHPNKPLTPITKTLLCGRLNQLVSEHRTPDHPPYSAMIHRALEELNEKRGCSEHSISQHLEKTYDKLPWAHSELLNHHLENLCESGELVVTRDKRYELPGCLKLHKMKEKNCERDDEVLVKTKYGAHSEARRRRGRSRVTENGALSEDMLDQPQRRRRRPPKRKVELPDIFI